MKNTDKNGFLKGVASRDYSGLAASLFAIAMGLVFGLLILFISDPSQAMNGFITILKGGFAGGQRGLGNVLYFSVPIMMTGLGVAFAFKTGLFNIGGPGQFIVGGFAAVFVSIKCSGVLPGPLGWIVPLLAATAAGALWTVVPGLLSAYANVNVVIGTIMMNYIGMYMVNYLVTITVYDSTKNQSAPLPAGGTLPRAGLDKLFKGSSANISIFIAIAAAILVHILINKTAFGYELRACGFNRAASRYAGINEKRNIIFALMISGALIGLGAGLTYLAPSGKYIVVVDSLAAEGFNGIPVALLALNSPLGVIFSALFIGYITVGGFYMQMYGFVPEIVDIIIASIIYFSALSLLVREFINRRRMNKTSLAEKAPEEEENE